MHEIKEWIAAHAPPDRIKGIRGAEAINYMQRLRDIDKLPPVYISISPPPERRIWRGY